MKQRSIKLAHRRENLLARSNLLRQQIVQQSVALNPVLSTADRLQDAWWWVRAHPEAIAAGALALVVWRPRKTWSIGWRAWSMWKLYQRWNAAGFSLKRFF
jgi:hypothetical protein